MKQAYLLTVFYTTKDDKHCHSIQEYHTSHNAALKLINRLESLGYTIIKYSVDLEKISYSKVI